MRRLPLPAILLLASCAAHEAREASARMIGVTRLDMESCAGIPARVETVGGETIATYTYESKGAGLAVGLPLLGTLSLSNAGQCTSVWRLSGDRVVSLRYTAASGGLSGPDAACGALVRGCLAMLKGERP